MATDALRVKYEGEKTITAAGTPVAIPAHAASAVLVMNNNTDGTVIVVGKADTVDALSTPMVGRILNALDSTLVQVVTSSDEVYVDSSVSGKKASYQILG